MWNKHMQADISINLGYTPVVRRSCSLLTALTMDTLNGRRQLANYPLKISISCHNSKEQIHSIIGLRFSYD